ncbi:restriction endonuclease subunit S [Clostridium sporogenes]|uniref:Restriction endonuclease subunit S n=1 Tax=Clostridium sporogenes TaxID=1509 RepID=A0A7X5P8X0_CLOSG|nr:restriction endonuclease subunit S [Clostridium sporogenes]AJD31032.1 type I restriction modification DNA specificity domain protein [Clostridium botulinum Prevot_594]NFQ16273.1 restriction endonuclease subunit S [Clostridium sporogenes]NFQ20298.1 restriction endonuclease subunit S [Clostridium sporogenes]NFQ27294.1 restriction endonuclease subunit S [Clostridium sporogenes]NFR61403.1 restriction endonuclease subunit S [Clostridium sporogenes]
MSFKEWKVVNLGDISSIKGGKRLPKGKRLVTIKTDHPYIKVKDMTEEKYISLNDSFEYVDDETYQSISRYIVNKGDVIISIVGTTGLVSIIDISLDKANLTENCVKLIDIKGAINDYIYYYLTSLQGQNEIKKGIVGSTQPKLPIYNIQKIEIPLPTIEEQNVIANILSSLDEKIETNNQINKKLEEMAQAIFKQWFVDFEFPNEDGEPYKSSGGEMIESEMGMIPKGWEIVELNNIADLTMGLSPKSSSYNLDKVGTPLLNGAADFENGVINAKKYTTEPTRLCKKNDLVFCIRATIGNITFSDKEYCLGRGVASITPKNDLFTGIIYFNLLMSMNKLIANATGSVILGLSKPDINNLKLILPDRKILEEFSKISNNSLKLKHNNEFESKKLINIRDTLLPKLMSGEIRVPLECKEN